MNESSMDKYIEQVLYIYIYMGVHTHSIQSPTCNNQPTRNTAQHDAHMRYMHTAQTYIYIYIH